MPFDPKPIASFVEYVVRPMSEDWRVILEKIRELNLPISEQLILKAASRVLLTHIALELVKWAVYVSITAMVCKAAVEIACKLP